MATEQKKIAVAHFTYFDTHNFAYIQDVISKLVAEDRNGRNAHTHERVKRSILGQVSEAAG